MYFKGEEIPKKVQTSPFDVRLAAHVSNVSR